jgi:drug/metabolite transporter (DMT)-like permease
MIGRTTNLLSRMNFSDTLASSLPLSANSLSLLCRDSIITVLVVASWYASNTGILIMNKALLTNFGFRRPLLLTLLHMTACAVLGNLCKPWEESAKKSKGKRQESTANLKDNKQNDSLTLDTETSAAAATSFSTTHAPTSAEGPAPRKLVILAAAFCSAVVLGNISLNFIPVSFSQAIGSTTPVFTAVMATILLGTREPPSVYATLAPIVGGVVIATGFEPSFHTLGFTAAVAAAVARSLKAVLQGILLTDPSRERVGSMELLRLMSPFAAAMLLPMTLVLEPGGFAAIASEYRRSKGFALFLFANVVLSYAVNLTNFVVTKRTSPLTLHVLGNAKGIFTTVASIAVFRNPVSPIGALGYLVAVAGTLTYGHLKWKLREEEVAAAAAATAASDTVKFTSGPLVAAKKNSAKKNELTNAEQGGRIKALV